jgi:hypothetical protein
MRIVFWNHFRALPLMLVYIPVWGLIPWFANFEPSAVIIFSSGLALILLPALFLHIEYLLANQGKAVHISSRGIITIEGINKKITHYAVEELEKIVIYMSGTMDRGVVRRLPMEFYFYVKILSRNTKEPIIITSLMLSASLDDVNILINKVPTEIKRSLFASIRYPVVLRTTKLFER